MHRLSLAQALSLWGDLDDAYHGKSAFGGDTAEIYVYRCMTYKPAVAHGDVDTASEHQKAQYQWACREANASLYHLLQYYAQEREAVLWIVRGSQSTDLDGVQQWSREWEGETHRHHVRVRPRRS